MANPNPQLHPENLIPAKPGEVRNPTGANGKGPFLTALLRKLEKDPALKDKFMDVGWNAALEGDFRFWNVLLERVDGKIPDPEPEKSGADEIVEELKAIDDSEGNSDPAPPVQE